MSESNLPPEQWRPLFDAVGIEFGYRPLAARAEMEYTRARRVLRGDGTTTEAVQGVADALRVPASRIWELRGEEVVEPFILPDDAGRLTHDERNVVRAMIRVLLAAKDSKGGEEQKGGEGT